MADAFNTTTSHSEFVPEQWMDEVILAATDHTTNAFLANAVQLPPMAGKGRGDIYHFPIQSRVNMADISEGTALEYKQFSADEKTLTINKYKGVVAHASQLLVTQSKYNVFSPLAQQIGFNAGVNLDTDLGALYASAGETVTGTTAANITDANVREAARKLDNAKAPRSGVGGARRFLCVSPNQMDALAAISTFSHADRIQDPTAIREGMVGRIRGFDVFMGHNLTASTDGFLHCVAGVLTPGNPYMSSLVWAPGDQPAPISNVPYADVAALGLRNVFDHDLKNVGDAIGGTQIYGVTMVRTEWTVDIKVTDN